MQRSRQNNSYCSHCLILNLVEVLVKTVFLIIVLEMRLLYIEVRYMENFAASSIFDLLILKLSVINRVSEKC